MDFFGQQDRARRRTSLLIVYFVLAVILIVAAVNIVVAVGLRQYEEYEAREKQPRRASQYSVEREPGIATFRPHVMAWTAGITLVVILGGTFYRWLTLRSGGRAVAELAGGTTIAPNTTESGERRLLNIVEEMSIASGVPMPAVYVLPDEAGINAFAAGYTPSDAAVAVSRGALERLNRDELQGVIAHEFSHILNGDMRLNIRLIGVLFGILMIAMIGRGLLHSLRFSGSSSSSRRDGKGGGGGLVLALAALGVALLAIGYIGFFFGRLIQAAVSRQREFLADAAAVQFTRNPAGIGGALKKIGGYGLGSKVANEQATQIRHLFFAQAFEGGMVSGLATHPPLADRIRAIEPLWDGKFLEPAMPTPQFGGATAASARAGNSRSEAPRGGRPPPLPPRAVLPAVLLAAVGAPTSAHLSRARALIDAIPMPLAAAAREPGSALLVVFGLLTSQDAAVRAAQLERLRVRHGVPFAESLAAFVPQMAVLDPELRLPLLNLTLPALRALPPAEIRGALESVRELIRADNEVSLFEFMVEKALDRHVAGPARGAERGVINFYSFRPLAPEVALLLSALSRVGAKDEDAAAHAMAHAAARVHALQGQLVLLPAEACRLDAISAALDKLAQSAPEMRKIVLTAGAEAIAADGVIETEEAELLRAVADALDCPIPPVIAGAAA